MGKLKQAFHDVICWNALDEDEKADVFAPLNTNRKSDRETLFDILTVIAATHGATISRRDKDSVRGYCGQGIDTEITRNGVGALVDISNLHGGGWSLIHWFNDTRPSRNFSSPFLLAVNSGGNGRPHHKATSHPRDWYSLAKMLDEGLSLAVRGAAFETENVESSAT